MKEWPWFAISVFSFQYFVFSFQYSFNKKKERKRSSADDAVVSIASRSALGEACD